MPSSERVKRILVVHRGQVLPELTAHFCDDGLQEADIKNQLVLPGGTLEKGYDDGGVVIRLSLRILELILQPMHNGKCFGEVPFLRHDFGQQYQWNPPGACPQKACPRACLCNWTMGKNTQDTINLRNADTQHLCFFLRFCTGSDLFLGKNIIIDFTQIQGFQRRLVAHMRGCVLELSVHYDSYPDFNPGIRCWSVMCG